MIILCAESTVWSAPCWGPRSCASLTVCGVARSSRTVYVPGNVHRWDLRRPGLPGPGRLWRCPMAATTPSASLVPVQPVFAESERLALAGFLAGYRGLTREACTLDLRQSTGWCRTRSLPLFSVRRPGPQRARRPPGRRRARPARRARADLPARPQRAARLGGDRRGHRAPGPGTRPPDPGHRCAPTASSSPTTRKTGPCAPTATTRCLSPSARTTDTHAGVRERRHPPGKEGERSPAAAGGWARMMTEHARERPLMGI